MLRNNAEAVAIDECVVGWFLFLLFLGCYFLCGGVDAVVVEYNGCCCFLSLFLATAVCMM